MNIHPHSSQSQPRITRGQVVCDFDDQHYDTRVEIPGVFTKSDVSVHRSPNTLTDRGSPVVYSTSRTRLRRVSDAAAYAKKGSSRLGSLREHMAG